MSGRKQHYIPQFIQKGFSDKKGTHIWVYSKEKIYRPAIHDNAAERDFYSSPENTMVDDVITSYEGRQSALINELRNKPNNFLIEYSDEIKHLFFSIVFRNKNFRDNMTNSFFNFFSGDLVKKLKQVQKEIMYKRYNINIKDRNKKFKVDTTIENLHSVFKKVVDEKLKDMIKTNHGTALADNIFDENYSVITKESLIYVLEVKEKLILGDSVVFFQIKKNNHFRYKTLPTDATQEVNNIIFPISENKIVIIGNNKHDIEGVDLNKIIASCSYERFFGSIECENFKQHVQEIGKNASFFTEEEYEEIVEELVKQLKLENGVL